MANTFLALLFACISYTMLNVSMVMQKKGASQLPTIEQTSATNNVKNFAKNKIWLLGFIMLNLKDIPFFIALAFGPLSLVTPMAGFGLVVLVLISKYWLGEEIKKPMYLGIIITIIGIVVIGITSKAEETVYTWAENMAAIINPGSLVVLGIVVSMMFLPALISKILKFRYADILFALAAGFSVSIGNVFSKIMTSGIPTQLTNLIFYITFLIMFLGNTGGVIFSQFGFQKGKAIIVTPIYAVCGVVIPVIVGALVFGEFATYDPLTISLKIFGVLLTVVGIAILSIFNSNKKDRTEPKIVNTDSVTKKE